MKQKPEVSLRTPAGFGALSGEEYPFQLVCVYEKKIGLRLRLRAQPEPSTIKELLVKIDRVHDFYCGQAVGFRLAVVNIIKNASEFHPADAVISIQKLIEQDTRALKEYSQVQRLPADQLEVFEATK